MIEKLEQLQARYEELTMRLSEPDLMANMDAWRECMREHATLAKLMEVYTAYKAELARRNGAIADEAAFSAEPELADMARDEAEAAKTNIERIEHELKLLLVPRDPDDDRNVVMEIRAGAGGEEAALFAAQLYRMYTHYAEAMGWKAELMDISATDIGGVKEIVFAISGTEVNRRMKYESGVHRVQRVPVTESGGRIHTSTVTVAVLPEAEDVEVQINQNDLRVDTYRSSGAGGQYVNKTESAIRITHIPTGIVVSCQDEKSQLKNKEKAMRVLKAHLYDYYRSKADAEYASARKEQVGTGDRSERIRTYNFPQGRVTDHRIGLTLYRLEEFINGDLDTMIDELILAVQTGRLHGEGDTD